MTLMYLIISLVIILGVIYGLVVAVRTAKEQNQTRREPGATKPTPTASQDDSKQNSKRILIISAVLAMVIGVAVAIYFRQSIGGASGDENSPVFSTNTDLDRDFYGSHGRK